MNKFFRSIFNPLFRSEEVLNHSDPQQFLWKSFKRRFEQNKPGVYSLRVLYLLIGIALFADFLANEKPIICNYKGELYFPVFRSYLVELGGKWPKELLNADWKNLEYEWKIFPPVPYLPQTMDANNVHSVSPFGQQNVPSLRWRHWLGTDELGRDVLSGMIHGTRTALTVGLVSMGIATLLGILIGSLAGYFGDERLKISRAGIFFVGMFLILGFFWGFISRSHQLMDALTESFGKFCIQTLFSFLIMVVSVFTGYFLSIPFKFIPFLKKKISIPVDILLSRFIEIMVSIPVLFLIISISAILTRPSIYVVMTIIGLISWTGIARLIRAEMLRIRSLEYIEAARALGYPEWRVIFRHAIPNALPPVLITVAFGIAAAILIESTLSFLGVGVSAETVTWGSLLAAARQSPSVWWLALIPGCAIFVTVTVFNLIGEALTDAMDPKRKNS